MRVRPDRRDEIVARLRAAGCVFAEDEAEVLLESATDDEDLHTMVARRTAGDPLELVVGWAELAGVRVRVAPGVFVPRVRSELLVREAAALLRPGAAVLDLCCGTGAVAAALLAHAASVSAPRRNATIDAPRLDLHAADIDPAAVACARANLGDTATVHESDLFAALPRRLRGAIDLLVANAPYVPTAAIALMPREARDHEPHHALDGGGDGVDLHRRIAAKAPGWLVPGGSMLIETSEQQAPLTTAAMAAAGLATRTARDEDLDATVVIGTALAT